MPESRQRSSTLIWCGSAVVLATLLLTLTRLPVSRGDGPFYASIARSFHYGGGGVPSTLEPTVPTGVDHIRFYGPVYFRLVDLFFTLFGVSVGAFRAVSMVGVLLIAAGGTFVCMALGGGAERRAWTWLLLLLTPEAGTASSSGRMDSLAVGLELCGLAIFLDGLVKRNRPWLRGVGAGGFLAAAALTTPRTFPFMFGFVLAMIAVLPRNPAPSREIRTMTALASITALGLALLWMQRSSGSPLEWFRLMAVVATHENTDVALLPAATVRDLMFVWWQSVTLVFSAIGAMVAAYLLRGPLRSPLAFAASFALVATWTTMVVTMTLFNFTFFFGMYFVLPLTAVVIGVPTPLSDIRRRGAALVAMLLFGVLGGVRVAKIIHGGVTWQGRDWTRVEDFVAGHVPPGSRVLGPGHDYFFPVEAAGSRYLAVPQVSAADWSRWVQTIEPRPGVRQEEASGNYLLWRAGDLPPPAPLACARGRLIGTFEPPRPTLPSLWWLVEGDPYADYPKTHLYALDRACGGV